MDSRTNRPLSRLLAALLAATFMTVRSLADDAAEQLFENEIRPLLVEKCLECHGATKQESGLRLDSREALIKGGEKGAAVAFDDPGASLLLHAVRRTGELEMPPEQPLAPDEIDALAKWIDLGAPWPDSTAPLRSATDDAARNHWAFQPVTRPEVPVVQESGWIRTPIDAFILAKLEAQSIPHAEPADRRTLIRRATYAVSGLPPRPEQVQEFVDSNEDKVYEELVDRLLDSPQYGEHWARHWLDLARYSDTKGYVYAREERFWVHAWTYRDWVVRSFNEDLPYDRFVLLQLAADQVQDRRQSDLAAMGFLTIGRRFLGVVPEVIDDRIDAVCRTTMALTVGCARCHDHKYDPIPTADYYSLYGVFDSSAEQLVALEGQPEDNAYLVELAKRQEALRTKLQASRVEAMERARGRTRDYLFAQTELDKYPAQGFDQIFETTDLLPAFVRRWEKYLRDVRRNSEPVWTAWHAFAELNTDDFAAQAQAVTESLKSSPSGHVNPLVLKAFATPPASFVEVIDRYAALLANPQAAASAADATSESSEDWSAAVEELRLVLHGPNSPCDVPDEPITHLETLFDSGVVEALWKLHGEVDRWLINAPRPAPHALTLVDRAVPSEPRIFRRGNPLNKGDDVPRQFLSALAGDERRPFQHGSGRLELAQAIVNPSNPLTARVIVNRVWSQYFGQGLVTTPSDFGLRSSPPSHPELLDWLACEFVNSGWSLKQLHRQILLSSTFRQSSAPPASNDLIARLRELDPDNRLLSRMNRHRLTFEEFRDSMLAAGETLDLSVGGRAVEMFNSPFPKRRSLYGLIDRQFMATALRAFDVANPDLHTPQRSETTVPQQALFFLNHPVALDLVRTLTAATHDESSPETSVRNLFKRVLQRDPETEEIAAALALVESAEIPPSESARATGKDWQYGYGKYDLEQQRVTAFTALPHFTGTAWQGGPAFPDGSLGWVKLDAAGGHPGNDRDHASIRRWTASRAMTIEFKSLLKHEPEPGDGVRAFVVSSRSGLLAEAKVHHGEYAFPPQSVDVAAGETIDFVVDIGDVLNSDQYLWHVTLAEASGAAEDVSWDTTADFTPDTVSTLTGWEQLAQVLLCTNEFLFVD